MRQSADKAHGIACDDVIVAPDPTAPGRRIKRRKELIRSVAFRARELIKERGLPGVGIPDERHRHHVAVTAGTTLGIALPLQFLQLIFELLHAGRNETTVQLNLFFAGAARFP